MDYDRLCDNDEDMGDHHCYRILNRGGHFGLTEAGKPTGSVQRSWLILALTEAVG